MYAGCVASAIQKEEYLDYIQQTGFKNVVLQKEKAIVVPDDILKNYLNETEMDAYKKMGNVIFSITVYGEKATEETACCAPGCCN